MTIQPTQPENNDTQETVVEQSFAPFSPTTSDASDFAAPAQGQDTPTPPFGGEEEVQPFTAFIEEFRQKEELLSPFAGALPSPQAPTDTSDTLDTSDTSDNKPADTLHQIDTAQDHAKAQAPESTGQTTAAERPVSPLLRPATRGRIPRQGSTRQREAFVTQASAPAPTKPEDTSNRMSETPVVPAPVAAPVDMATSTPLEDVVNQAPAEEVKGEESESPRPARRYRFDRPAPTTQSSSPSKPISLSPSPARIEENRDARLPAAQHVEITQPGESPRPTNGAPIEPALPEGARFNAPATKETVAASESEVTAAATPAARTNNDRRRRHGQEGQHAKTLPVAAMPAVIVSPVVEEPVPVAPVEITATTTSEIPVEDLPPLEYSDLQAASRRRRRRRPNGTNGNGVAPISPAAPVVRPASTPSTQPVVEASMPIVPVAPARPVATPPTTVTPIASVTPYSIQSGVTVSQMNQGNDTTGPFQSPEPSPARGSVFPTQSRLVRPLRNGNESQRNALPGVPAVRSGDGMLSTGAVNHLANVITQAIQLQSDRQVAELRRANQTPANISVTLPPFPSTERVGVFVDVANLLYSARTLRMTLDFGKLLDFLRGNRRLVRAHAYCPTSPQAGDDQMFLQAVKGLGYRITTKDYKTFASGAKKADMDLDLCMDVVRLVDGKSVDCVVLVSGDGDFIPMLDYCSDHGVRIEVAAFDESMSASLRQSCDLFINLSMLDEIRVP